MIAQALPAYTTPGFLEPTNTPSGLMNTLAAWSLAYVAWGFNIGGALAILIAWTANIWLVLAIVLWGLHRPGAALGFAILAVISAAVGMWFLLSGGLPDLDSSATVTEVGIGSWVWFASTLVVLAGSAPRPLPT